MKAIITPEPASSMQRQNGLSEKNITGSLENHFSVFRENIIGQNQCFESPFGPKKIIYADWTASGRSYGPIEEQLQKEILPFVGNPHSGATVTGTSMSIAYEKAKTIIREHVNAAADDVIIFCGSGTTAAVNKLQRLLGLRIPERITDYIKKEQAEKIDPLVDDAMNIKEKIHHSLKLDDALVPVVFVTHMEHHSNHTSWLETIATVEMIKPGKDGNVDLDHFRYLLEKYKNRKTKIAAVTACSNVTGIETPYHAIAKMVHEHNGLCFIDFACAAPYISMNMHPPESDAHLDAVYFSPHKFLGGPGTPGVLIINKKLCCNLVPDHPGGGTVSYTNPWNFREYIADIEQREDGGTPAFFQVMKAAMCVRLKEAMGVANMHKRETEMLQIIFARFEKIKNVALLEKDFKKRLPVISFIVKGAHHNLIVKLLNDRFGIQARGGCSCAGGYGHLLLNVDRFRSYTILEAIRAGDLSAKPGWTRISLHPTMTNAEIDFIMDAIHLTAMHFIEWARDYRYDAASNEFYANMGCKKMLMHIAGWFDLAP